VSDAARPGVVVGYLSIDHVVRLETSLEPNRTALVGTRLTAAAGRPGGCAYYVSAGLSQAGARVETVGWVAEDEPGRRLISELTAAGVGVAGIDRSQLERTPSTWLSYGPAGESYCVYDPGGPLPEALSPLQANLARWAPWCVLSVSPPGPAARVLGLLREDATLLWAVKADQVSFGPLAADLEARSDIVVFSEAEAAFLVESLGEGWEKRAADRGCLVVETRGAGGCRYSDSTGSHEVPAVGALAPADPTGAGDRFVAGLLAALLGGVPPATAVRQGQEAAAAFLATRGPM
jgi:ribokinase